MLVRFWGVRGPAPWSSGLTAGFGCHTPCVELRDESSDEVLILDAGTGIIGLGQVLARQSRPVSILLSHFHWDHVQGLPHFAPVFEPGARVGIWAPALDGAGRRSLEALFAPPHCSIGFERLPSPPTVSLLDRGEGRIGGFHVSAVPLNHPGGAFAYRVRGTAADLVYITDHEFGNPAIDEALAPFALNSGATVLDAQFTPEEMADHAGGGHSSWQQATEFASATGAGHLWLFHHKPGRSDDDVRRIEARARKAYPATRAAREGDVFTL
jgi:phosphoribosyl 1,2-cyclic phosphodiesterase